MSIQGDVAGGSYPSVRSWVRRMILRHVPPKATPASIPTIAARAEMEIHAVRDHLACMGDQVGSIERRGRRLYYRITSEDKMAEPEPDYPDSLTKRIVKILKLRAVDGRTTLALAHLFHVRPNKVSGAVRELVRAGVARREGKGKRGDPYRFFLASVPIMTAAQLDGPAIERRGPGLTAEHLDAIRGTPTGTNGAATSPVADELDQSDTLVAPESGLLARIAEADIAAPENPAELAHCYSVVIEDVVARATRLSDDAAELLDDAKIMTAAATVLIRILDGEADR